MACHSASLFINVERADGRTADQAANVVAGEMLCSEERYSLSIAYEKAVLFPECGGQATSRKLLMAHADSLYTLTFIDLSERYYAQVITSFAFLQ